MGQEDNILDKSWMGEVDQTLEEAHLGEEDNRHNFVPAVLYNYYCSGHRVVAVQAEEDIGLDRNTDWVEAAPQM